MGIPDHLTCLLRNVYTGKETTELDMENSAVATGLEKVSFHFKPKERPCQEMLKLPHSFTHLTHQQSNARNSPSQASTICEL